MLQAIIVPLIGQFSPFLSSWSLRSSDGGQHDLRGASVAQQPMLRNKESSISLEMYDLEGPGHCLETWGIRTTRTQPNEHVHCKQRATGGN